MSKSVSPPDDKPTPVSIAPLTGNGAPRPLADDRQLPPHRGKLSRIQTSAEGAADALKEWVDLRIELVKAEIEEVIAEKQEQAKFGAILGFLALLAVFMFLLVAGFGASAGFEALLGWAQLPSLTAGYGLVLLIILIIAGAIFRGSPFSK